MSNYTVGKETFKTKKAIEDRAKQVLWSTPIGQRLSGSDYDFMYALLQNHECASEKVGCGVRFIYIGSTPGYEGSKNGRGFWIERTDGSKTDFSYRVCITPNNKDAQIKSAFRAAIADQIQNFKTTYFQNREDYLGRVRCQLTREMVDFRQVHIDHLTPITFDRLLHLFIIKNCIDINTIKLSDSQDGHIGRFLADQSLAAKWAEFHRKYSVLRVISIEAHKEITKAIQQSGRQ